MNWTWDDINKVIEFARIRGGDCSLVVAFVTMNVLAQELNFNSHLATFRPRKEAS